jgi:hypothetical protein
VRKVVVILALLLSYWAWSQDARIQIIDGEKELPLEDALVKTGNAFVFSDALGFVNLKDIAPNDSIYISALGFKDTLLVYQTSKTIIKLFPLRLALREVLVIGQLNTAEQYLESEVLSNTVSYKQMRSLPAILGEPDILRPLANLPGVQSSNPGGSSLFVRGGDSYHNNLFLDGIPFYNMDHAFGFVSAIPTLSVESVKFHRDGMPAEYGGALSSAIAVKTVQPSLTDWSGRVSVGLGSLGMHVSAPVLKNKWSIGGGFRRSVTDLLYPIVLPTADREIVVNFFGYNDFNLKSTYKINANSYLEALFFQGTNRIFKTVFSDNAYEEGITRSRLASLSFKQQKKRFFQSHQLFYSGYGFELTNRYDIYLAQNRNLPDDHFRYRYNTHLHHLGTRSQYSFKWQGWKLKAGGNLNMLLNENPSFSLRDSSVNGALAASGGTTNLFNVALFTQGAYKINQRWLFKGGLRAEVFPQLAQPLQLLPKAMFQYTANENWSYFLGFDRNSSFVHRFRATYDAAPADLPFLASDGSPVSTMNQYSLGAVYKQKWFSWNSTVYYRNFNRVLDRDYEQSGNIYAFGLGFNPLTDLSKGIEVVNGNGYGLENRAQMQWGIARLDLAYTWSRAFRQADDLNNGDPYPFEFNREHMFTGNFILRFKKNKINKITEFSLSYNYGTGNFTQFALQRQLDPFSGGSLPFIATRNNAQLPAVQHLDFAFNFIKEKNRGKRIFTISVFNATFNRNIFRYSETVQTDNGVNLRGEGTLPIFPSFSYAYFF